MTSRLKARLYFLILSLVFAGAIIVFYLKYVPLVAGFQLVLAPVLFCVWLLTFTDLGSGTLGLVFFLPLINNLPYLFGIQGDTPHAPTALVLFLFYFSAILLRQAVFDDEWDFEPGILRPMLLFSLLLAVSGAITFLRYANFFPFYSDSIYELSTNAIGVSAGGALMSVVFTGLNYLSGFVFFFVLIHLLRSEHYLKRVLVALFTGSILSFGFGWYQRMFDSELGNTLVGMKKNLVNATFKDALSFGAFLAMVLPLLLGAVFSFKKGVRILAFLGFSTGILLVFFTGSKSGLLGAGAALVIFLLLSLSFALRSKQRQRISIKKFRLSAGFIVILILSVLIIFIGFNENLSRSAGVSRFSDMLDRGFMDLMEAWRIPLWNAALAMIGDYPLTGVGVGGYIIELPNYSEMHRSPWEVPQSAENYFLHTGAEMGLLGLAAVLSVFGCLIWQMSRIMIRGPSSIKQKYLIAGALSGAGAYLLNILFHTYVGSYEIKGMFWLLAALLFSQAGESTKISKRAVSWKGFWIFCAVVTLVFTGFSLWNSTHSLSLEHRIRQYELYHDFGFYPEEQTAEGWTYSWSGRNAGRWVDISQPRMIFSLHASHPDMATEPVRVELYLIREKFSDRKLLDEITLQDPAWQERQYRLETSGKKALLLFKVSRTWNPKKERGVPDPRDIGVAVSRIQFEEETLDIRR